MEGSVAGAGEGGSSLLFDMPDHLAANFEEIRRIKSQGTGFCLQNTSCRAHPDSNHKLLLPAPPRSFLLFYPD